MKFKYIIILFILTSCIGGNTQTNKSLSYVPYSSKGFAMLYDDNDYKKKIISKRLDPETKQVAHNIMKGKSLVQITNPVNKKSIIIEVSKRAQYPTFYTILLTKKIFDDLEIDEEYPFVEIEQKVKNRSFVAKKAETFSEEKNVSDKAPISEIKIDNISKDKDVHKQIKKKKFNIIIGEFYSKDSALSLKSILEKDYVKNDTLSVKKLNDNKYQLISGPHKSINTLKKAYFELNKYGFEDLDIKQK